jgi:hypothetical protein
MLKFCFSYQIYVFLFTPLERTGLCPRFLYGADAIYYIIPAIHGRAF